MGYKYTENPDGTLTIRDYALMAPLRKGEKGLTEDIAAQWFKDTIANHKATKRSVYLFDGHNETDKDGGIKRYAPIVGRAEPDHLYWDGQVARASEVKVTDPRYVALFKRSAVGNQSAEFFAKSKRLLGVALLGGIPGHQDDKLPEPRLEGLSTDEKAELVRLASAESLRVGSVPTQEITMLFSEEQIAQIKEMIAVAVKEAMAAKAPAPAPGGDEPTELNDGPFSENFSDILQKKLDERDAKNALKACRDRHILQLAAKPDGLWNETALRQHFGKCETEREVVSEFRRLSMVSDKAAAQLVMAEESDLADPDYKLRKEAEKSWESDEENWKALNYTRETFIKNYVEDAKLTA